MTSEAPLLPRLISPQVANFVRTAATTTVVAATAPETVSILLVASAYLAAGAAWYYFSQRNKEDIQAKAKEKYIAANPDSDVAGKSPFEGGQDEGVAYRINFRYTQTYKGEVNVQNKTCELFGAIGGIRFISSEYDDSWQIQIQCKGNYNDRYRSAGLWEAVAGESAFKNTISNPEILSVTRLDGQPDTAGSLPKSDSKPWTEWTDAQRQDATDKLTDSDWHDVIKQMPSGGTLERGQALPNDVILTGNPESDYESERETRVVPANTKVPTIFRDQASTYGAIAATGAGAAIGTLAPDIASIKQGTTDVAKNTADVAKNLNEFKNDATKRLKGIAGFLNFDRILNLLIWWQTLHNAFMLSADLSRSLVSAFSTALKALPGNSLLGLPTESADGTPLDLATIINKSVETWIKGAIGVENYKVMKLELAQINRIYQSTANIWSNATSAFDSLTNATKDSLERLGMVGNALRKNGVVRDDAYKPFPEKVTIRSRGLSRVDRVSQGLEALSSATSAIESVASDVVSIQEEVSEIKKYRKEYQNEKTKLSKEIEKKETDSKKVSSTPDIKEEEEQRAT